MVKKLSFSYSKMGMYKECPQKYKFRYVHMLPEQPKYFFAFGTALHSVMEFIYNPKNPLFPSLSEALAYFDIIWKKTDFLQKGYASAEKEAEGYAEGRRILEEYYAKNSATFAHPLSVEMRTTLDIDGMNLISILDRMDYLGDGNIKILDYKTGKTVQREPDQLYMYQKVAETSPAILSLVQTMDPSVKQVRVKELSFYHLPTLQEMSFERAPDTEILSFWQRVLQITDSIRAGKFDPTPGDRQCRWCDYRNICPVFTGKEYLGAAGGEKLPSATPAPIVEADRLSEKIDRYGALLKEIAQLKQEIISLMKENHFDRHFGAHYRAELERLENIDFTDKQKVIDLLRELALLNKVLVPTKTTILSLLDNPDVSVENKEKLRALTQRSEIETLEIEEVE